MGLVIARAPTASGCAPANYEASEAPHYGKGERLSKKASRQNHGRAPRHAICLFLPILIFVGAVGQAQAGSEIAGIPRVVDADTIEIGKFKIRLFGIDAPESRQTCTRQGADWLCAQEASRFLRSLLANDPLKCTQEDVDRYGRIVATCINSDGEDISSLLVSNGWALAYERYSPRYKTHEIDARARKVGLWSGEFIAPSEWRRGVRSPRGGASADSNKSCRIKGNINSKGERIFHTPGTAGYESTRIDITKGERHFCSEAEALEAGFRLPR